MNDWYSPSLFCFHHVYWHEGLEFWYKGVCWNNGGGKGLEFSRYLPPSYARREQNKEYIMFQVCSHRHGSERSAK